MTGVVSITQQEIREVGSVTKYIIDWTSDSSGNVESDQIEAIGYITEIERVPGENGDRTTSKPSASYDTYIKDRYGASLISKANNGDADNAQRDVETSPLWVDDYMVVSLTDCGNTKKGRLIVWVRKSVNG